MDKKLCIELLKNEKLTENLMKDKEFKAEAKNILKQEKPDITDKDIENILKAVEKILSRKENIKSDEDLDKVVGGLDPKDEKFFRVTIKVTSTCVGAGIGAISGDKLASIGGFSLNDCITEEHSYFYNAGNGDPEHMSKLAAEKYPGVFISNDIVDYAVSVGGGYCGLQFGEYLCKKLGLEQ